MERLINLAFALAHARQGLTRAQIRDEVRGYPADQDDAAFARMFERDKKWLRGVGLAIDALDGERYVLDAESTFASSLELTAEEASILRTVGTAIATDPAFPFPDELQFALAKLATGFDRPDIPIVVRSVDEFPKQQAEAVALLEDAVTRCKAVRFSYTNARDEHKQRSVEPHGLYFRDGRWYLVGRDTELAAQRTYAVMRMADLQVNTRRPESPDFEQPTGFDVAAAIALPFQYGAGDSHYAQIRFPAGVSSLGGAATAGKGTLVRQEDGSVLWTIDYVSADRLCRWVIENGQGLRIEGPSDLRERMRGHLETVVGLHSQAVQ